MRTAPAPPLLIQNGTLILPDKLMEGGAVLCERGKLKAVGARIAVSKNAVVIDAKGGYISPGFIDIHVHGGAGADFMDGTVPAVRTALKAHARHGTTTIYPTTTTGAPVQITAMLNSCREARRTWEPVQGSRIAGVHLYGPYFAADKVGCHSREGRRAPDAAEYARWFRDDLVRIATCAAELPGAVAFYQRARKQRCLITCGHSNANWAEMEHAFKAGMRHVDHFWCAMSSVSSLRTRFGTPMQASMEQFVLATADMSTEVIADGMHLAPELLDFAFRMKGAHRLCLVTDCNRALDMPPGRYRFGSEEDGSWFESDGKVGFVPGEGLASSVVGLDHMVRHMKKSTSATLPEAVRMASLTPAERTGIARTCGSLEKGKQADVLVLNRRLEVQRTFISGVEVPND
ncbi:MAG: N-acetylglucosamine-6-phosphate deacetylase [Chthoniobacter sp. 12-60-6]|nr:MAG: N-acetylglucosamine-6-phosphate deacetylase [Chthoniobacter sp. 12-60-6]